MTKLALLALAFTAIVAFAEVSAYETIVTTTTIEDENFSRGSSQQQCSRQIQLQQLSHCQMHLTQFEDHLRMNRPIRQQEPHLELCCQQLRNVREECQCEAIQKVFDQAQQQFQRGGRRESQGQGQSQQMEQIKWKAQQLPQQCNLEVQEYCRIQSARF